MSHPIINRRGFSLVEMLVVITIITAVTFMLVPATTGLMRSYQLNTSTQAIVSQLGLARQTALTRGYAVQVRFYYLPDYNKDTGTGTPEVYRGMQCFLEGDPVVSGTTSSTPLTALSKPVFFSQPVIVLDDNVRSTLLTLTSGSPTATEIVQPYKINYKYISFRYKPNGQTDLPDTATTLTLVLKGDAITANGTPANFRTLGVDLYNGSVRLYQP